jgi:vancomycin permeability regulator SanA
LKIITKWFVIDVLKLISCIGIAVAIFVAVITIQVFRPTYSFVDTLLILAVGMILGASYIQIQERASDYFDKQSKSA